MSLLKGRGLRRQLGREWQLSTAGRKPDRPPKSSISAGISAITVLSEGSSVLTEKTAAEDADDRVLPTVGSRPLRDAQAHAWARGAFTTLTSVTRVDFML